MRAERKYFDTLTTYERKRAMVDSLLRNGGNMLMASHELGLSRRHFYRLTRKYHLWPAINQIRLERKRRDDAIKYRSIVYREAV